MMNGGKRSTGADMAKWQWQPTSRTLLVTFAF